MIIDSSVMNRAGCLIAVRTGSHATKRRIKRLDEALTEDAQNRGIGASKETVAKRFYQPITTIKSRFKALCSSRLFGFKTLRSVFWCPTGYWPILEEAERVARVEFYAAVENMYQQHWVTREVHADALQRLGAFYDEGDYPTDPRPLFRLQSIRFNIGGEEQFSELSGELSEFKTTTQTAILQRIKEMLERFRSSLRIEWEPNGDASRGQISTKLFDQAHDMISVIESVSRDIQDDPVIDEYIAQLRDIVYDAEGDVRDVSVLRKKNKKCEEDRLLLYEQSAGVESRFENAMKDSGRTLIYEPDDEE